MPLFIKTVVVPLAVVLGAVKLAGKAAGVIADIDHFLHFFPSFLNGFSNFNGNQLAKSILFITQGLAQLQYLTSYILLSIKT